MTDCSIANVIQSSIGVSRHSVGMGYRMHRFARTRGSGSKASVGCTFRWVVLRWSWARRLVRKFCICNLNICCMHCLVLHVCSMFVHCCKPSDMIFEGILFLALMKPPNCTTAGLIMNFDLCRYLNLRLELVALPSLKKSPKMLRNVCMSMVHGQKRKPPF